MGPFLPLPEGLELFLDVVLDELGNFLGLLLPDLLFHALHDLPELLLQLDVEGLLVLEILHVLAILLILLDQSLLHPFHRFLQDIVGHRSRKHLFLDILPVAHLLF